MNETETIPIWAIVYLCGVLAFVLYTEVYMDGWRRLAKRYRISQSASGRKCSSPRVTIDRSFYVNGLTLTTNADGLFMELSLLYRLWRPRLFIPWQDFHNAKIRDYKLWRTLVVEVGNPCIIKLRLPPEVFEQSEGHKVLSNL